MTESLSLAVSKRPLVDRYDHPVVRLLVAATGETPVAVRLVETLPSSVDETAIGFHRDERYEHWSVTGDGRLVYEDVLREGETASTLYGLVDADADLLAECLAAPAVQVARTADLEAVGAGDWVPLGDDSLDVRISETDALGDDSRPTDRQNSPQGGDWADSGTSMDGDSSDLSATAAGDSMPSGGSDTGPRSAGADESTQWAGEAAETAQTDGSGTAGDAAVSNDDGAGSGADGQDPSSVETGPAGEASVVEAFAAELRRDEPSEEAVATLRSHLRPERSGGVDAKLDHCLSRIAELDAYVDALEAFLDEEGTADQLLAEVRDDIRTVEASLDDLSTRVESVEAAQSRLDDRLESMAADVAAVESDLDRVDELDGAVEEVDASLGDVSERVEDLDRSVHETRVELETAVENVEAEVATVNEDLDGIEEWRSSVVDALSAAPTETEAD